MARRVDPVVEEVRRVRDRISAEMLAAKKRGEDPFDALVRMERAALTRYCRETAKGAGNHRGRSSGNGHRRPRRKTA